MDWAILKTHLMDPEAWLKNVLAEKIRACTDRVYEETTEKIAGKRTLEEKHAELSGYELTARTENDKAAVLRHELKGIK